MIRFIDEHRDQFGVDLVCRVLRPAVRGFITSRVYRAAKCRPPSAQQLRDDLLVGEIARSHAENYRVDGRRKMHGLMRVPISPFRNAGQFGEPRDRHSGLRSCRLEVFEGISSMCSAPLCQIRNCTVASANASFSCSDSNCRRRSNPGRFRRLKSERLRAV